MYWYVDVSKLLTERCWSVPTTKAEICTFILFHWSFNIKSFLYLGSLMNFWLIKTDELMLSKWTLSLLSFSDTLKQREPVKECIRVAKSKLTLWQKYLYWQFFLFLHLQKKRKKATQQMQLIVVECWAFFLIYIYLGKCKCKKGSLPASAYDSPLFLP